MNRFSISKERTAIAVQIREFTQKEIVYYGTDKVYGIRWTASDVDGLDADSLTNPLVTTWVGSSRLDTTESGAGPNSDGGSGLLANVVSNF